ncbi:MAG: hypothetical protein EOO11_19300 [Chitinophagaceae bacterium]|nr:MAG: hypothetical protein EOO11_19300 [Chitinophagaceae bacterium]
MAIPLLRLLHLLLYFVVAVQLVYYLYLMGDALQQVSIGAFLEERRIVHPLVMKRHQAVYYACLATSVLMLFLAWRERTALGFVPHAIALLCLVADIVIAMKGNGPINTQIQAAVAAPGTDWEALRTQWLTLIKTRGAVISAGMLALFIGLVWRR